MQGNTTTAAGSAAIVLAALVCLSSACLASTDGVVVYVGAYDSVSAVEWSGGGASHQVILSGLKLVLDVEVATNANLLVVDTLNMRLLRISSLTGDILDAISTQGELPVAVEVSSDGTALLLTASGFGGQNGRAPVNLWSLGEGEGELRHLASIGFANYFADLSMGLSRGGAETGNLLVEGLVDGLTWLIAPDYREKRRPDFTDLDPAGWVVSSGCNEMLLIAFDGDDRHLVALDLGSGETTLTTMGRFDQARVIDSDCEGALYYLTPLSSSTYNTQVGGESWRIHRSTLKAVGDDGAVQLRIGVGYALSLAIADRAASR